MLLLNDRPNFSQNDKNIFPRLLGHRGGRARKASDGVFRPIYYIVGRRQKRSWECGQSFFRRSLVLKAQKASVFKAFLAFGLGLPEVFGRRLSGVLLPKNEYKKDTLQNTECLIVFDLFPYSYKAVVRGQKFLCFRSKLGLSYNSYPKLVGNVGEKRHLASSLDSSGKLPLQMIVALPKLIGTHHSTRKR